MDSEYYQLSSLWTMFVAAVFALGALRLFWIGGASMPVCVAVGALFVILLGGIQLVFGGALLPADLPGSVFYALILGGAAALVLILFLAGRGTVDRLSQTHFQALQGFRVFVAAGFLMEGVLGVIPGWFSILDGYMHAASGYLALNAAILFALRHSLSRPALWLANIVGLVDIAVIVTSICFVVWEDIGPAHNMNYVVFGGGPVLLWLHFLSIKQLLSSGAERSSNELAR